jgi:hypothetical protein
MIAEALRDGILVPAVVSTICLAVAAWRRRPLLDRPAGALAAAGGFFAGYAALGWAPLLPADRWHWLPHLALVAAAAGLVGGLPRVPPALAHAARAAATGLAAWRLAPTDADSFGVVWVLGLFVAMVVTWELVEEVARRQPGALVPLLLTAAAGAAGVVLVQAGSAKFAQLAGVLAAALGPFVLFAWRRPNSATLAGAVPVVAVLLPGLMAVGKTYTFSDLPRAVFVLAALAPLGLAAAFLPVSGRVRLVAMAAGVLAPAATAVALALSVTPEW